MEKPLPGRSGGFSGVQADVCDLRMIEAVDETRVPTGMGELDRVLGGGIVAGSVVLIGGDPGIGKSTLLLQMLAMPADDLKSLYVSGEESAQQIALRARRLGVDAAAIGPGPAARVQLPGSDRLVERT